MVGLTAGYGWDGAAEEGAPEAVRAQVDRFVRGVQGVLGADVTGIYLHGSLAMGCFNPDRSDIDLLVVTRTPMDARHKRDLATLALACSGAPRPLEVSFLTEAGMRPWRHPAPFDLHYSESYREAFVAVLSGDGWVDWLMRDLTDPDLAAHITVTLARGICLAGAPAAHVFAPVPRADYVDALWYDVETAPEAIVQDPVYLTLNLARVLCYLREGRICSKQEGGEWGARTLPAEHRPLLASALACYRGAGRGEGFDPLALQRYALYMDGEVRAQIGLPPRPVEP